jgi:uncharacterized protein
MTSKKHVTSRRELDAAFEKASVAWDKGDTKLAFELFLFAAERGDTSGKHSVGYFYDLGIHVRKDSTKALFWYRLAYKDGSSAAATNIATVYRDLKEYGKMIWWIRRAVAMGDGDALLDLALCYLRGKGVKPNREKAIQLLRRVLMSDHVTRHSEEIAARHLRRLTAAEANDVSR